jgi:hypothetical protein
MDLSAQHSSSALNGGSGQDGRRKRAFSFSDKDEDTNTHPDPSLRVESAQGKNLICNV